MKLKFFICLLLLSVSLKVSAATGIITREVTMTVGETKVFKPYEIGLSQSSTETYYFSDPEAFTIVSRKSTHSSSWAPFHYQWEYTIKALKKGTYTFTVEQFRSDTGESAVVIYNITVNAIDVTSITLNETEGVVCVGGTKQLVATIEPNYATDPSVSWMSTNESVAAVNTSGLVTGKSKGTAWIAATTNDGTNLTAMCKMTVKAAPTSIQLNYNEAEVHLQQTLQLNATILPADAHQEVQWSSSNPDVATVDDTGLVTPISLGNTIIYVATTDGSNKKTLCVITVLPAVATDVQLNQTTANLKVAQTLQLNATVTPSDASQAVAWTSSNTSVATVNENGLVTAVNLGDATITATTKDGTNLSASCAVTVVPEYVTGISLNQSSVNMHFGESSQLIATINPADASQEVTWSSSDPSVVVVDEDGFLFANSLGQATITATATATTSNGANLSATCNVVVSRRYSYNNDVNQDGSVTSYDITALYNYLLNNDLTFISTSDVNDDGKVTAADITAVYEELLNGTSGFGTIVVEYEVNGVRFNMVKVEGGTFTMGATEEQGSEAANDEKPAHEVTLSPYFIGQTEVTQELWQAVMGSNPSNHQGALFPVEKITWDDCNTFISKLNQMTGKNFRLPTEAEWEYAARGGQKSQGHKYSGSDNLNDVAWYKGNAGGATHEVRTKAPNELEIYDMSGNVNEWCKDYYDEDYYSSSPSNDPQGPSSGGFIIKYYVVRGGSIDDAATNCRVSKRARRSSTNSTYTLLRNIGMRLALSWE